VAHREAQGHLVPHIFLGGRNELFGQEQ
jgi:hypothetical protein